MGTRPELYFDRRRRYRSRRDRLRIRRGEQGSDLLGNRSTSGGHPDAEEGQRYRTCHDGRERLLGGQVDARGGQRAEPKADPEALSHVLTTLGFGGQSAGDREARSNGAVKRGRPNSGDQGKTEIGKTDFLSKRSEARKTGDGQDLIGRAGTTPLALAASLPLRSFHTPDYSPAVDQCKNKKMVAGTGVEPAIARLMRPAW